MAQTAFRTRSAAEADAFATSEGADSSLRVAPQATDPIHQLTALSSRRIVRHAATSAAPASAVLTTAVPTLAALTTAVPASAVLTAVASASNASTTPVAASADSTTAVPSSAVLTTSVPDSTVLTTAVEASADVPATSVCDSVGGLPPGDAGNASSFFSYPRQTPLRSAPSRFPLTCQAIAHEGFPSTSRAPTKEGEYGTTRRSRRSGPASEECSLQGSSRFTTPPRQVDVEPPGSKDAKLEVEVPRGQQEGSSSGHEQRKEGSFPQGEWWQEGFSRHQGELQEGSASYHVQQQPGAGGTAAAVATAPAAATAGARAAPDPVEPGPAHRPCAARHVGVPSNDVQDGRRG